MARFLEDYKPTKKKKKETPKPQKVTKSPSVTKANNVSKNSTFLGGGADVKKAEQNYSKSTSVKKTTSTPKRTTSGMTDAQYQKTYGEPRRTTAQRTSIAKPEPVRRTTNHRLTAAQTQKMYGTTNPKLQTAEERRREREERRKEREERRLAAQRQKSGLNDQPTAAQKAATDRAIKNTPGLIKKAGLDAASGYGQTLTDVIARTASSERGTEAKAMKMGIEKGTKQYQELEEERKRTAEEARKDNQSLYQKMQQRQAAWDEKTKNAKGFEKAYYGAVESGTGMVADTAIGLLTGTGQVGALASMGLRTYGSSANQARSEGATDAEAGWYGLGQAVKEMGTEMIGGGGLAKAAYGKGALSLGDIATNTLIRNLKGQTADLAHMGIRLFSDVAEENIEELAGWALDPWIKELTYGRNVRDREGQSAKSAMRERSDALRAEIQSEDDARAAAAYISSDDFVEQTKQQYIAAGMKEKEAEETAERMRDYLTASLTGDTDSMEKIEDDVYKKVAGSHSVWSDYSFRELKETFEATTLLVGATGLPGNLTTMNRGNLVKDQLGEEGVRALANTAIDFEDAQMSTKAKAMKARMDEGKELTGTQVYELQAGMQEQVRRDTEREQSSRSLAARTIESDNLLTPYRQNENGGLDLDEVTKNTYRENANRAGAAIDALTKESKESITDTQKVDGSKAIAGFQTGVFTVDDANALNYSNTTVRAAFEAVTGVNLGQYIVRKKNGEVDIPATNTKTKDALFAMAADNLVKSAQAETANWMDNAKGQVVTQVTARMGARGSEVLQMALDGVDERDRSKYMMTANATDMLYQAARNMGTEWESISTEATRMFPGISESKLKAMYEAGLEDRDMANDKARGRQIRMGEALSEMGEQETATGKVYIDSEVPPKGSVIRTFTEIAKNLGADIHFVDYIYDANNDPIEGANGSYDPNTNTFYLNVSTGAETNIGYIFMHETTHYLKRFAPEQYQALENLVRERWFAFNPSQMQDAIARKIEAYKRVTKGQQVLTEEQALEEIIADASHDFINDPEFAQQVAEEDMGLAKAVLDSIRNALRMLRRIFASGSVDDDTHMNSLFRELDIMTEAEKLWLDAYKVAVRNSSLAAVDTWQDDVNEQTRLSASIAENEQTIEIDNKTRAELNNNGVDVTEGGSAIKYSLASWNDTDKEALVRRLVSAGYEEDVARRWVDDVNSVATTIFADMGRLNYEADQFQDALKPNSEYYFTLDLSTLCQKRRLYQGTYNAIMHRLVNKALHPEDTVRLRKMMADMGYETPCGICYEESRKKNEGKFAEKWLDKYKAESHDDSYEPTLADVTTTDGRAMLREEHPSVLESYLNYQKGRGSANPKVSFTHTDYRGDILRMTPKQVENVKHIGGLRIQSFSDFETVHVIDMMQAIMDMASMKLTSQAYTKVPAFADIFGGTGIKINLSLIGQVDETGELKFDAKEGIDPDEAFRIRDKYSKHVGTILVGANTESILKAWADPRIDMVIPFHRSGWAKKEFEALGLGDYEDFQEFQSERYLDGSSPKGISLADAKMEAIYSADYWDYSKSGKENAEAYLKLCAEKHYRPVFYNFLHDNGDGTWSLQEDGSTDGYWKSLVDFKMYDNDGVGSPQELVQPNFDMDVAARVMSEYEGNADTLPVAQDVVDKFVGEMASSKRYSISTEAMDSDGNILTDGQMEYFKNSKARDEDGRLVPVYHTTNHGGFTIFDPSFSDDKRSLFFASNWNVSQTYGRGAFDPINLNTAPFEKWEDLVNAANEAFKDYPGWDPDKSFYENAQVTFTDGLRKAKISIEDWMKMPYREQRDSDYVVEMALPRLGNPEFDWQGFEFYDSDTMMKELNWHMGRGKKQQRGYYSCYLNLQNPLIVDAKKHLWREIPYGPEGNSLEDHLKELEEKSNLLIRSVLAVQGAYNDDGWAHKMDIQIEYMKKKPQGGWYLPNTYKTTVDLTDTQFADEGESSLALWTETEMALQKFGLPSEYITRLEVEHTDYDGDIVWTAQERGEDISFDYINTNTGDYEIVDRYEFDVEDTYTTRQLAELAEEQGYDGVVIRNCYDIGGASHFKGDNVLSDIFIAFSPEQVKDIRNENPTENPDIRYSFSDEDDLYSYMASVAADSMTNEELAYYEQIAEAEEKHNDYLGKMRKWSEEKISEFYESLVSNDEMPSENEKTEEGRIRMSKAREDFFNSLDAKWNDKWLSNGEVLDLKSVKPRIKQLIMAQMRGANATRQYKTEVLNRTLFDVRTAYMMAKRGRIEVADEIIWNSAKNMIANLEFVEERADYETFKEIRDFVKGHRIQIDEGDFPSHDHYKEFLKSNFGRMTLVKDGTGVDQVWQALNEKYGNLFPEEVVSPLNQLEWIADYLNSYEPIRWAYSSEQAAALTFDIADELGNIVFGYGKPIESLADHYKSKYEEKAKALKARCVEAERELRKTRRENESNEAKIARLQEKNQRIEKKLADEKQKSKDKAAKKKDIKERARYTGRIQKNYDWLTKRLLQPTKDKNIPEGFRKDLARLLCMFDLQTERSKELEQKYGIPSQKTFKMWDLHSKLCNVMNEDNGGIFQTNAYIEFLSENLAKRIDGKSIDSLETPDLLAVDEYLKIIVHQFREYDKVRVGEKRVKLDDLGGKVIQESDDRVSKRGQSKEYGGLIKALDSVVNFAELTPIHFFQRMGTMYTMYKEVRKSFDKYIRNEKYLLNKIQNICGEYYTQKKNRPGSELEAWRDSRSAQELRLKNGTVTMTVAQMMSLYCLSKRNQALLHMTKDGIVITPITEGAKIEKARADFKGRKEQIHSIQLTLADIDLIKTKLTPDQMKIADKLQELMSGEMAEWGNEMSMKLYGIRMFKEKDYFPIKVSSRVTEQSLDDIDITETIKNFGFTKPTQPNARNAIEVDDIFKVVADHCNNMNLYNAYGESISDFWRVFNYKQYSDEGKPTKTVQQALEEAYGKKAIKYIKNFIKDINGNVAGKRSGGLEEALNATLGKAKKAAVFGNMRVALQQPTAIVRAFAVLSPKYIGAIRVHKGAMQEMFEHCPIAQWKSWGFYDTYMGRDIEDVMMNKWSMSDTALSGIYGQLDNITWTAIWQMCKAEVKDTHPNVKEGTQEFWDLCNERASEVFDKTQVVDSPFHRSDAMRSKDIMVKSLTSFQSEPTLTFNVVRSGFAEAADALRNGNRTECTKKVAGTVAVFVAQAAVVSATAAIWDAVRRKNPDGGDDDDKKWVEFWTMNFINNLKDNINLLNNIYLVKEIMPYIDKAFFGGYGASNNLLFQSLDTLTNGITQFQKKLEKGDAYDKSWYDVLTNLFGGFGYMFGIPVKTLMKDFKGITSWLGLDVLAADEASLMDSVAEKMGYKPIDKATESKWFDYERNPFKVTDGSTFDNILNHFGWNLTEREKEQIAADEAAKAQAAKAEEIAGKTADLTGEAKDKKVWSYVTSYMKGENDDKPLADVIQEGDYKKVQEYRDMYVAAGGDTEYFDERIFATSKSAMKKTIVYDPTDAQIEAQDNIKNYLLTHGMSDYELSEMAYKSNTAKDMKIAFMINDKDAMLETLEPLVRAGLSYEDLERIWDNRNRIDVMKYKSSKGRYADRLKSTGKFIWPTNGQITSYFGRRNAPTRGASSNHPAIDIGAPMGADVVASDGGVVIYVGWNGGYGNSVGIKHDNGMVTYYNHLSGWSVKEGDTVAQGQQIANVGSTGVSTGPHLDFKVLDANGKPVDPLKYLASRS